MSFNQHTVRYGNEVVRIEPIGIEHIEEPERHGRPFSVFTLWWGANVELATLTTGVAAVYLFGLSFWQAALGLFIGNLLGVVLLGLLSTFGPKLGVPQMVHSRAPFGFYGNFFPGTFNLVAGMLWFAVNTVLGAFAFEALFATGFFPALLVMVIIQVAVAVFGHNMIHAVERVMAGLLTVVFLIVTLYAFGHGQLSVGFNPHAVLAGSTGVVGGVIEAVGLALSYLLGWTVFASDYTRYLPTGTSPKRVFGFAASANFVAALWLELVGVAMALAYPKAAAASNPMTLIGQISSHWVVELAMLAVIIGTVTANVLNIYSGSLSALVINLPVKRWLAAIVIGVLGGLIAWVGHNAYYLSFENFLFLLAYWLAPWAGVVLVDFFAIRHGRYRTGLFYDPRRGWRRGFWAWLIGIAVSVPFFNQALYQGAFASHHPGWGDIAYYIGFGVAAGCYWVMGRSSNPLDQA